MFPNIIILPPPFHDKLFLKYLTAEILRIDEKKFSIQKYRCPTENNTFAQHKLVVAIMAAFIR